MSATRAELIKDIHALKWKFNELMEDLKLQPAEQALALDLEPIDLREVIWINLHQTATKLEIMEVILDENLDENMRKLREERP